MSGERTAAEWAFDFEPLEWVTPQVVKREPPLGWADYGHGREAPSHQMVAIAVGKQLNRCRAADLIEAGEQ